jgi:hypothetical protein
LGAGSDRGREAKTLMPRTASIQGQGDRPPRDPPAPTRRTAGGIGGNSSRAACRLHSKGAPGRRGTDAKPPTPLGFSTRHRPARAGLEKEGSAPPPRRAGQGRSRGPEQGHLRRRERRRPAKDITFNRRSWEGERAVRVGEGSRTGAGTPTSLGMPLRHATAVLDPATTTQPPQREHHRRRLLPFLPP